MHNLEIRKLIISCNLTPEQWGLYDCDDAENAATALNSAVMRAFESYTEKHERLLHIYQTMKQFRNCGSNDSDAHNTLDEIFSALQD